MITQAKEWYADAVRALAFRPYREALGMQDEPVSRRVSYRALTNARFEVKEFAWHPIGKIVGLVSSLLVSRLVLPVVCARARVCVCGCVYGCMPVVLC